MKIRISALYAEPGISFEISYKVMSFLEQTINRRLAIPDELDEKAKGWTFNLMISTKKECRRAEAKGPDVAKRTRTKTWGIWLPYEEIIKSPNQLESFVNKFFEAAGTVLVTHGVKTEDIEKAEIEVKKEIIDNDFYVYSEEKTPQIDLSKIKF